MELIEKSFCMMINLAKESCKKGAFLDARVMIADWLEIKYFQNIYRKIRDLYLEEGGMTQYLLMYQYEKDMKLLDCVKKDFPVEIYDQIKSTLEGL